MKFLSNAHTHTTWCDGKNSPEEMLQAAQELQFVSIGFTGHAAQGFDANYCMSPEAQAAYLTQLRELQACCTAERGAPKVYVGLEQDTLIPDAWKVCQQALCDYVIGSTHYLTVEVDGQRPAVDGDPVLLQRAMDEHFDGDALALAQAYFDLHSAGTEASRPDVIGHFDLVRKYAPCIGLDTACSRYRAMALDALERVSRTGSVLEVNTGAIARGFASTPYPDDFLLRAWREMGGTVTLTSDCHDKRYLDCAFDAAMKQMKRAGFKTVRRLGTGTALWDEVTL